MVAAITIPIGLGEDPVAVKDGTLANTKARARGVALRIGWAIVHCGRPRPLTPAPLGLAKDVPDCVQNLLWQMSVNPVSGLGLRGSTLNTCVAPRRLVLGRCLGRGLCRPTARGA